MYSLERNNLAEGVWDERKRTYRLTEKGKKTIETILSANDDINILVSKVLNV